MIPKMKVGAAARPKETAPDAPQRAQDGDEGLRARVWACGRPRGLSGPFTPAGDGPRVTHPRFGPGTVVEVRPGGKSRVRFDDPALDEKLMLDDFLKPLEG